MNIILLVLIILLGYFIYLPVEAPKSYPKPKPIVKVKEVPVKKSVKPVETVVEIPANRLPTSADKKVTIEEDSTHILDLSYFAFSDKDASDKLVNIKITKLENRGSLEYLKAKKWKKVTLNQVISREDLQAKRLKFRPARDKYGNEYSKFTFMVSDGRDYSKVANTIKYKVTPVNDIPTASSSTIELVEGSSKVVDSSDFKFKDVESGSNYSNILVTKVAQRGALEFLDDKKWVKVKTDQKISKKDIDAKKLRFSTEASGYAKTYASFSFKISDGEDYSKKAYKITYRVTQDMSRIFANGQRIYEKECRLCHGSSKAMVNKYKRSKLQKTLEDSVSLGKVHEKTNVSSRTDSYFKRSESKEELKDIKYYILNP